MEEQTNILKKMGSYLTKLEEAKIKKTIHVDIHDKDEGEEWDERDNVEYERKKQFKKLTVETIAMKEKMELAFCKAQGMDDCLYNIRGISSKNPHYIASKVQDF